VFAAPPTEVARVFATVPESFSHADRSSPWVDVQFQGAPVATFIEGPSFDRDGNLWIVDIPWGRIFKISPAGEVSLAVEYDGEPNGLKFHWDGRAIITDHKNGLMALDPASGRIEPYLERALLQNFMGLNDLVFASNGDLYFTDQGQTGLHDPSGRLYRLRANGDLDLLLDNVPSPNGLVLNRSENTVFLAVTRDNAIWRVPLMKNGLPSKVGVFIQLSGGSGPDGLAIDEDDNLAICHVGLGSVWLFSAHGEPMLRVKSPAGMLITNCAYGGPDRKTLFITESKTGTVLAADLPVPGRRMFSHHEPLT
jgi:gluconolactonase